MSKLSSSYIALQEGKISKSEFLRQARQLCPQAITQHNTYDDAIKILRNRGLLSEAVIYQCKEDMFSLEAIDRGIRYELEKAGIYSARPGKEEYAEAKRKAVENLSKDPLYYLNIVAGKDRESKKNPKPLQESITSDNNERQDLDSSIKVGRNYYDDWAKRVADDARERINRGEKIDIPVDSRGLPIPPTTLRQSGDTPVRKSTPIKSVDGTHYDDGSLDLEKAVDDLENELRNKRIARGKRAIERQRDGKGNLNRWVPNPDVDPYYGRAKDYWTAVNDPYHQFPTGERTQFVANMENLLRKLYDARRKTGRVSPEGKPLPNLSSEEALASAVRSVREKFDYPYFLPSREFMVGLSSPGTHKGDRWICLDVEKPEFARVGDDNWHELNSKGDSLDSFLQGLKAKPVSGTRRFVDQLGMERADKYSMPHSSEVSLALDYLYQIDTRGMAAKDPKVSRDELIARAQELKFARIERKNRYKENVHGIVTKKPGRK